MSKRPKMLASVIRELVAPVLRECPTECGIVSITDVEVSPDGSYATLFVSALTKSDTAMQFLEKQLPSLQRKLAGLPNRRMPKLRFRFDPRSEQGSRIDSLLGNTE